MGQRVLFTMVAVFIAIAALGIGGIWLMSVPLEMAGRSNTPATQTSAGPTINATASTTSKETQKTQPTISNQPAVLGARTSIELDRDKLYSLINGYRREKDLPVLKAHALLEQSSADKLYDMEQKKYWSHYDPEGREPWYLFNENGYQYELAGENLSFGYTTEWQVFTEWQKSPEHNAQLLEPRYEHMGLASDCRTYTIGDKTTCIVVLHLGKQLL